MIYSLKKKKKKLDIASPRQGLDVETYGNARITIICPQNYIKYECIISWFQPTKCEDLQRCPNHYS
jgi:hypothetical protein